MRQKIFIVFLPSYIRQETRQRINRDVANVHNFMQDALLISPCFTPFGDGIKAMFFVKDGADLGLYCLVEVDLDKITLEDKEKLFKFSAPEDWKGNFIELIISEVRKLLTLTYPCRLFRKIRDLCKQAEYLKEYDELLKDAYAMHPSLKEQENDPLDTTPFYVDEAAYQVLKANFYRNIRGIKRLLSIPEELCARCAREDGDSDTQINTMWATIAQEERIALIIFFLFVKPEDGLFLRGANAKAEFEITLSDFHKALLAWL